MLGIFFNIIAPSNKLNLPSIGFIFSGIWILSVAYSIAKYKMFTWKTYIAPHVVDHLGEIIVVVDEGLHINYVNDIFYEKLEKEVCDPTLLKLSDFVPDIDAIISHNEFSNNKIKEKEIDLVSYGVNRNKIKTKVTGLPLVVDKYTKIVIFTFSDITYRIDKLMKNQDILLEILAYVAESKSIDFEKHIERMSEISVYIAEMYERKFPNSNELIDLKYIKRAASLHDIGKFTISDSILNKNGKLSDTEFALVKEHTKKGFDIISTMEGVSNTIAASVAKNHHEKWDGTGYPYGLTKKNIPLIARIVSIADVVDALLTKRTYKEAMSVDYVEKYLENEKGKSFDPDIIDLLLENNKYSYYKIIEIYNSL